MAAILQYQKKQVSGPGAFAPGHTAQILLFTGVRFERIDFDALRLDEATQGDAAEPARRAN